MTPVANLPRSVQLFSSRAPFISDADPCCLSRSVLICSNTGWPFLLCDVLSWSVPVCYSWHLSMPPVLLCASLCRSFQICTSLCRYMTPKAVPIILMDWSLIPKSWMNTSEAEIPYPTITNHTSSHPSPPYYTPQLWHQNNGTASSILLKKLQLQTNTNHFFRLKPSTHD